MFRCSPVLPLTLCFTILVGTAPARAGDERTRAALLLERATYGPRPGDLEQVLAKGVDGWLDAQLSPETIDDGPTQRRVAGYPDLQLSTRELMDKYPRPDPRQRQQKERGDAEGERLRREMRGPFEVIRSLSEAKLIRAVESERQLQELLVDFWFNHFNVFARKDPPTTLSLPSYERDAIRPHVLGSFHDLLLATAQHPAMLRYLDNWISTRDGFDPRDAYRRYRGLGSRDFDMGSNRPSRFGRRAGGELGARPRQARRQREFGLNENYARELLELHTLGVDGGYDQQDVIEVARCFTGWTVTDFELMRRRGRSDGSMRPALDGEFHFLSAAHDAGVKTVLGQRVDAGGIEDGRQVLLLLSRHPATAHHICRKLAARFVAEDPSPEIVAEMEETWRRTDGDLREVVRTMFLSDRFVIGASRRDKVKTPLELAASAMRATGSRIMGGPGLARAVAELGMPLYLCQPPTGYAEDAETWLSAGTMLNRIRFVAELVTARLPGVRVPPAPSDLHAWASDVMPLRRRALTPDDERTLREALAEIDGLSDSPARQELVLLLAGPEFQRQ